MAVRHFEVAVIGGTYSAVLLAAILAKRGVRGILVDQGELAATEVHLSFELGLADEASPAMDLVHSELGIGMDLKRRSKLFDPNLQVILPDQRFDLFADRTQLGSELVRAFGESARDEVAALLEQLAALELESSGLLAQIGPLPARGFFAKRSASQLAKKHLKLGQSLAESGLVAANGGAPAAALLGLLPFATHLDAPDPTGISVIRFVRCVSRIVRGLHRFEPTNTPREIFLEAAKKSGFELMKTSVSSVDPSGRVVKLSLERDLDGVTAECLIDATCNLSGVAAIPNKLRGKGVSELIQEASPKGGLHGLIIELDRLAVPPAMGDNVLLLNGRKAARPIGSGELETEDRPILLLRRAIPGQQDRLRLYALHPLSAERAAGGGLSRLEKMVEARVERLIPFLPDANPTVRLFAHPREDQRGAIHPHFDPGLDPMLGISGVSAQTPHKNVFVAGPSVLPGLGVEGAYFASLEVAELAETLLGRKKKASLQERLASKIATPTAQRRA
jgi:hypothetical protein